MSCVFTSASAQSTVSEQEWVSRARSKAKEEDVVQRRVFKISQYMEKARKLRAENKFSQARSTARKALSMNEQNAEALAFLEQLDDEENYFRLEKERLKKEKKEQKQAKIEAKKLAKEKKKRAKKEKAEAKVRATEEAAVKKRVAAEAKRQAEKKPAAKKVTALSAQPEAEEPTVPSAPAQPTQGTIKIKPLASVKTDEKPAPVRIETSEDSTEPVEAPAGLSGDLSQLAKPGQSIIVDGDKVEYFEKDGKIVAEGDVSITYGDVKLSCDRIEVNTKARQALCEGNVLIEQPGRTLSGDRIRYDFAAKRGEIVGAEVEAFPWFGQAEETGKVGDNEYVLKKGFISTCDLDLPHYRLKANEIRIFPNDKVIAKNVTAYIGKVPVLWFPYYYQPMIQTKAKVQFIPGSTSDWGYFLLSAWRMHIKGNSKADILFDYRTKKGFAGGANLYYKMEDFGMEGLGEGMLRAYFINQNGWGTYDPTEYRDEGTEEKWRRRIQWKHRLDFDPETTGMLEFNKMSDENVLKDYFYNEYEETNSVPRNYISVVSAKNNYTFSLTANKRFNDFYTVVQRLPELKLEIPDQRLWKTPIYYTSESSATYFDKQYKNDESPTEKVGRLDSVHRFSYVANVGPLNLTPYAFYRGTAYERDKIESKAKFRNIFGGGIDTFMRFHKVYDVNSNVWGLNINGLRHIVVPSVNYFYRQQPNVDKNKLYQMDEIDALEKENKITLSLENKLQTKRGEDLQASVDLVRSIVSIDYEFRMKKNNYQFQEGGGFRNLKLDLELSPNGWFYVDNKLEITPGNQAIKTGSVEASIRPNRNFRLDLGYRYEKMTPDPRNQLTFELGYVFNPKWRFDWYERFDLHKTEIEEQQFSIVRDLHCWEVEVTYDLKGDDIFKDDFTFWVAFRVKAFPDLNIGLNRSFEKRPPGPDYR
ncbi:MAG: LPS assembly protein LptD [Candidatus Tantalella remota]|nr:LPS assembly protein LptD [Candidatus Tantalella remota]